jgi:DNA invertase Pin-like site-specific DNA recombinase
MRTTTATAAARPRFLELVRVSGAGQAARDTPEDQRAALDQLRQARPGVLVERIEEGAAGLSGALPLDKRPDLLRLIELARAHAFDEVRVRHIDRLTRHPDPRERYAVFGAVMDAGAVIIDAGGHVIDPSSEMGELDYAFQTIGAARERKRIMERTSTAKARLAKEGKLMGPPPFGRSWDKHTEKWSFTPEIEVYRRVFKDLIGGKSANRIARDLTAEGVPTPGAAWRHNPSMNVWTAASVCQLVRNTSAIGRMKTHGTEIACPPVVDQQTFDRAQECLDRRNAKVGRPPREDNNALLRRTLVCGCGAPCWVQLSGKRDKLGAIHTYYVCSRIETEGTAEEACRRWHAVPKVDAALKEALLAWRDGRLSEIAGAVQVSKSKELSPEEEIKRTTAVLKRLDKQEDGLLRLFRRASVSPKAAERQLAEVARERRELEAVLSAAKLRAKADEQAAAAASDREKAIARIRATMKPRMPFSEWRKTVEALLPRGAAQIHPDGKLSLRLRSP